MEKRVTGKNWQGKIKKKQGNGKKGSFSRPGTNVSRLKYPQSEIFEGFRQKGLIDPYSDVLKVFHICL